MYLENTNNQNNLLTNIKSRVKSFYKQKERQAIYENIEHFTFKVINFVNSVDEFNNLSIINKNNQLINYGSMQLLDVYKPFIEPKSIKISSGLDYQNLRCLTQVNIDDVLVTQEELFEYENNLIALAGMFKQSRSSLKLTQVDDCRKDVLLADILSSVLWHTSSLIHNSLNLTYYPISLKGNIEDVILKSRNYQCDLEEWRYNYVNSIKEASIYGK